MVALKNSDRSEVLRRVLEGAFAPRFAAITERIAAHYRARMAAEHPRFLALLADESARPYIATCGAPNPYYEEGKNQHSMGLPARWGSPVFAPHVRYLDQEKHAYLRPEVPEVPTGVLRQGCVGDDSVVTDYLNVWGQYVAAQQKLSALLYSYATREKLAKDFPEYARYLPALTEKAKLPVVIVSNVRAELSALGIPVEESQP